MFALESKCITAERKFTAALRQQFKILASAWNKKGLSMDYTSIWFQFKRNFPLNLLDEAQSSATLKGLVSEQTRLSQLSFVDDIEFEMEQMEKEIYDLIPDDPVQAVMNGDAGATTATNRTADRTTTE